MENPALIIMAAGMGSRYGGLKQIDPVDKEGHIIMDFSIFDAKRAGFEKVVFIISCGNFGDFVFSGFSLCRRFVTHGGIRRFNVENRR